VDLASEGFATKRVWFAVRAHKRIEWIDIDLVLSGKTIRKILLNKRGLVHPGNDILHEGGNLPCISQCPMNEILARKFCHPNVHVENIVHVGKVFDHTLRINAIIVQSHGSKSTICTCFEEILHPLYALGSRRNSGSNQSRIALILQRITDTHPDSSRILWAKIGLRRQIRFVEGHYTICIPRLDNTLELLNLI